MTGLLAGYIELSRYVERGVVESFRRLGKGRANIANTRGGGDPLSWDTFAFVPQTSSVTGRALAAL